MPCAPNASVTRLIRRKKMDRTSAVLGARHSPLAGPLGRRRLWNDAHRTGCTSLGERVAGGDGSEQGAHAPAALRYGGHPSSPGGAGEEGGGRLRALGTGLDLNDGLARLVLRLACLGMDLNDLKG